MKTIIVILITAAASLSVYAHSGGTDRNGCHADNKTGGWHCH